VKLKYLSCYAFHSKVNFNVCMQNVSFRIMGGRPKYIFFFINYVI
jgi:hypothetical protein